MSDDIRRRDFIRTAAATGAALAVGGCMPGVGATPRRGVAPSPHAGFHPLFTAPPIETVRMGFVGVGHQGSAHVRNFLRIPGVEVVAVCDLVPEKVARVSGWVTDAGRAAPSSYTAGPEDYRRMVAEEALDLVFTATPWSLHAPVCIAAMEHGKHAATEVPMAVGLDELWAMVETAERTRRHCVMMENCCYDRTEMMILNMVRQGVLGELLHAECGYLHDLRALKLTDFYEGDWRVKHSIARNGDLYPTHGLGPVAQWMNVNRGNRFDHLVSVATKTRGLNRWAAQHIGPDSDAARRRYALGDTVNTLIRTANGETIQVVHDTNSPRPYSRKILLQGTRGVVRKYPEQKIHIEGTSPAHQWEDLAGWRDRYDHPIWRALEEESRDGGHGGMDYIEDYRLIQCLRDGAPMDMDVYDGAAWSAVSALSERSIASRQVVDVPDFTRGAYARRPPLGVVGMGNPVRPG
ncbi:MAG TPA: Gfo/Idh/MocA family oxidoreductase [Longimicrobiales bacterium]|nr:Gfo/Idh/MocA family oxidoreductase [Longimicrobiales bacterium]